jgi:hypothetical protein
MPAGAFTAARHFSFDDAILDSGTGVQEFKSMRTNQEFKPQCIHVNRSNDDDENAAGYAWIRGYLFGENESYVDDYCVDIRRPVGYAFRAIYSEGTTARGIKLLSEI